MTRSRRTGPVGADRRVASPGGHLRRPRRGDRRKRRHDLCRRCRGAGWRSTDAGYVAMENLAAPLEIGHESDGWNQFDGGLDECACGTSCERLARCRRRGAPSSKAPRPGLVAYWRFNEGVGLSVADDSPGSATAVLMNGTHGRRAPGARHHGTADRERGCVSNLSFSATITFTTNEAATGWVTYMAGTACPCVDVFSAGAGISHVVTLTGLAPDTPYQFRAKASDGANNQQVAAPRHLPDARGPPDRRRRRWQSSPLEAGTVGRSISLGPPPATTSAWSVSRSSSMAWRWARRTPRRRTCSGTAARSATARTR